METFLELRDWVLLHRDCGRVGASYKAAGSDFGDVGFKIYEPKLPGDEVQFRASCCSPKGIARLKFDEHPDIKCFWVFALLNEGEAPYEHIHEVFKLSEPLENLKKVFNDGRYDYLVDSLMADTDV